MAFPHYPQLEYSDCGVTCVKIILRHFGKKCDLSYLRNMVEITRSGISMRDLSQIFQKLNFEVVATKTTVRGLKKLSTFPSVLHWDQHHFVVLYKIKDGYFYLSDPGFGKIKLSEEKFARFWAVDDGKGVALAVRPNEHFQEQEFPFEDLKSKWERIYKTLGKILLSHKKKLWALSLFMLLSTFLAYIFPQTMQNMIDLGVEDKNIQIVWSILFFQIALLVGQTLFNWLQSYIRVHFSMQAGIKMISDLLDKLLKLPVSFFESSFPTDILEKIDEQEKLEQFLSKQVIQTVFACIFVIALTIRLVFYDPFIALIFIGFSAFSIFWLLLFYEKRKGIDYYYFRTRSENRNHLQEMISGMIAIKANGARVEKISQWHLIQKRLYQLKIKTLYIDTYQMMGVGFINKIGALAINFLSVLWIIGGSFTLGEMVSIGYIIGLLNQPIQQILTFINSFQQTKLAFDRVNSIHEKEDENEGKIIPISLANHRAIHFKNVSFKYPGSKSKLVLKDLNFHIPQGKTTAIVGESGSGKTTLLKLLMKFYEPVEGEISVDNIHLNDMKTEYWRDRCGIVMQDGHIFSGTIGENISMTDKNWDKKRLDKAVEIACLSDYVKSHPMRYNTKIGDAGKGLSGGQKQRLLIARAAYKKPDFLFLDEATSSLDAKNERSIVENLATYFADKTMVVIAHRLSTVKNADQIIVLENGEIVEINSHNMLIKQKGYYYSLIKNQLELGA
ncbi:MAG: peptidase domain-containing ABC transporter [Bacteroidota bacterium]